MQQNLVYHYLPQELKSAKKGRTTNISYTQKMGFSNAKFILPNSSECLFRHYRQKEETIEGGNCDLIWADEMVPLNWIETLRYRLVTRAGLLLISFTPIQGWTPCVKEYLDGAQTVERVHAPLLPKGSMGRASQMVPRIQQPATQQRQHYLLPFQRQSLRGLRDDGQHLGRSSAGRGPGPGLRDSD